MGTTGGYAFDSNGQVIDPTLSAYLNRQPGATNTFGQGPNINQPINWQTPGQQTPQQVAPFNPDPAAQTGPKIVDPYANTPQTGPQANPTGTTTTGTTTPDQQWATIYAAKPGAFNSPQFWESNISNPTIKGAAVGLSMGKTGEDLVNFINQTPGAGGAAYYGNHQPPVIALGSGYYMAQDGAGGSWSLIAKTPETGGVGGAGGAGGSFTPSPPVDIGGAINSANMASSPSTGQANSFMDLLMKRANESLQVNPQDPIVKAQTDAFAASGERQLRNYLSDAAEKAGPGGNIGAVTMAANENLAQADATFTGQVLQNELSARRQEVAQALSLYGSTLTEQQQLAMQEELAKLDAALAQAQLQQGAYQFDASRQDKLAGF